MLNQLKEESRVLIQEARALREELRQAVERSRATREGLVLLRGRVLKCPDVVCDAGLDGASAA
jgi:hypothetical protein